MVGSCDNKEGEVVAVLVGGAQGDRLGGVLVGAHDRLGLRHQSLLRRLKVRAELGNVAVGAARVPGETRISAPLGARSVVGSVLAAMRPVVRTPARRIGGCTAKRDVALGEGRRRHAGLCAHGGYLVGCHEPLRELELVLYPTTRIGPHVYVAAPGLAMVVVYGDADGLAWLPVRSSEGYSRTRRIVRLVAPDLLHGQCASARLGYVRPTALDRGRFVTVRVTARFTARGVYVRLVALARGRRQYVRAHVGYERHRRCGKQHSTHKE